MGVTAKFIADFDSFYSAVQKAEAQLRGFEGGASKVETSLNRMANSLSGTKLIQDATLMAQAVEQIGGTSKLTTNELASLGTKANEAVEKMRKLGIEVPPGLQAIADATRGATHETQGLTGMVERLTERFVVYETLGHIFDFAKDAIESTARIEDLSKATGLSTDAIQRFSYVGKEFGIETEQMARGVEQLSAKIVNDKGAKAAIEFLGLSVKDLIAQRPEEAFLRVAESVGRVENPTLKAGLAAEVFGGKLAKVLLPVLTDLRKRLEEVPQAAIISDDNVKAAHDFDVGLSHAVTTLKAWTIESLIFLAAHGKVAGVLAAHIETVKQVKGAIDAAAAATTDGAAATTGAISAVDGMRNAVNAWRTEALEPLNDEQMQNINLGLQLGKSQAEIAKAIGASEIAVHQYVKATEEQLEMWDAEIDTVKKFDAVMSELHEKTFVLAMERKKAYREETIRTTAAVNAAQLAEFNAQVQLNAEYGLAADGQLKVTGAAEIYRVALEKLHATKLEGISQAKQEQVLIDAFTRSLYDEATAMDNLAQAAITTFAVVGKSISEVNAEADRATENLNKLKSGGVAGAFNIDTSKITPGNTDPIVYNYLQMGYTVGEAFAKAAGYGTSIGPPQHRAAGGPVEPGRSYVVGEHGPEVFKSGSAGTITPSGGASIVNNFYINGSIKDLARPLMEEITRAMKQSRLFPSA